MVAFGDRLWTALGYGFVPRHHAGLDIKACPSPEACRSCLRAQTFVVMCLTGQVIFQSEHVVIFPSSVHKLYRAWTNNGWACENFCRAHNFSEPGHVNLMLIVMPCSTWTIVDQGPISLTFFPSQFKFDWNFVSLSSLFLWNDRYKILYIARQLCCRGMCKNLLRSDGQQRNYGKRLMIC